MKIQRTTDATLVNEIANHPSVRPWVAPGLNLIDLVDNVTNPNNIALIGEHGCFLVFGYGAGIYEAHTMVLPAGRGAWSRLFCVMGSTYMFCQTDCAEILTRVPEGHAAAAKLTQDMGFEHQFTTPPETEFLDKIVSVGVWSLPIQKWAKQCTWFQQQGADFHEWMGKKLHGEPHAPDPDHNHAVGVTLEMIRGGQIQKGVVWYNRWALAARHPTITLLSMEPPQIKFDAGILVLRNGLIEIEQFH